MDVKILIVDDHDLVRMCLSRILDDVEGFRVIGEANTGESALKTALEIFPDIILMDIKMPGIGGIEATRRLTAVDKHAKVIAVTACEDELYPVRLIQAGAAAYLTKKTPPSELIKAVKAVVAGKCYVSREIAQKLAFKSAGLNPRQGSPFESLSDRELQVAIMVVSGEKVSVIAEKLSVSSKTINSYRYRIFDKFNISSDVELVHLAIRHELFGIDTPD